MADIAAKSKSALKKAKQKAAAATPALSSTEKTTSEFGANGSEQAGKTGGVESVYIKEIQKCVPRLRSPKSTPVKPMVLIPGNAGAFATSTRNS